MRWLFMVLLVVSSGIIAISVSAQSDPLEMGGEDIPRCTQIELLQISGPFSELIERYQDLDVGSEAALEDQAARREYLTDFAALQQEWWDDIYPAWPECAFVADVSLWIGRVLDETIITLALFDADPELAEVHLERLLELRGQLDLVVGRGISLITDAA